MQINFILLCGFKYSYLVLVPQVNKCYSSYFYVWCPSLFIASCHRYVSSCRHFVPSRSLLLTKFFCNGMKNNSDTFLCINNTLFLDGTFYILSVCNYEKPQGAQLKIDLFTSESSRWLKIRKILPLNFLGWIDHESLSSNESHTLKPPRGHYLSITLIDSTIFATVLN